MGNKLFIILLSAILSYTANASNETVQGINTDDNYNRIQLREQLATAWQNIQPEVTLTINQENPQITNNSNTENNQDKYIIISINPGFFHTPTPEIGAADSFLEVKSIVPFRTELAQDIEAGLGLRKGALRFEGGLRWIRFHASNNLDETIFWENLDIAYLNDRNILPNPYAFDALDALFYRFGHGEIVDNLGIVGGIVYDIQIANENVFYVGGKIGALRASLGHITSGINDWTTLYQFDVGITKEVTDNFGMQIGYQYSKSDKTSFKIDGTNISVGPVPRHAARFSLLFSVDD